VVVAWFGERWRRRGRTRLLLVPRADRGSGRRVPVAGRALPAGPTPGEQPHRPQGEVRPPHPQYRTHSHGRRTSTGPRRGAAPPRPVRGAVPCRSLRPAGGCHRRLGLRRRARGGGRLARSFDRRPPAGGAAPGPPPALVGGRPVP